MIAPVLLLVGIAFVAAIILGIAARVFYVEEDPRIEAVADILPGANCGGCGQAGCSAAAEAMVKLIHKYVYADRPYEKAAPSIRNGAMRISKNAALNMASVKDQLDWFLSEKLVKDGITMDTLVDTSYTAK